MLRLQLLDQFTTEWNNSETVKFPSHKSRALFAYLATERVPHTRIKLANLLWADSSDGNARNSVRVGLYRLRRLFDKLRPNLGRDLIKTDRTHVTLSPDLWCDVTQFQTLWQTIQHAPNAIDTLEKAVALYQSDFLSGFPAGVSENFDEWLQLTRQQLHTRAIQLFDQLLGHYLAQGRYEQLILLAQRQIGLEAWHETAHLNLMLAHAHLGQTPEALRAYERCQTTLDHELGVAPSIELTKLANAIRSGAFANEGQSTPHLSNIRRQAQHNLPQALPTFFARQTELKELTKLYQQQATRWITLAGPGGMGKSRLSMEVGRRLVSHFPDGVWFVALAGLQATINLREQIAMAIGDVLSISFGGSNSAEIQVTNYLQNKHILLILDNFEHILDGANIVYDLLNKTEQVSVLCTSREPLYFQAERVMWLNGLATPTPTALTNATLDLHSYASVQLFIERATRLHHSLTFTADMLPDIGRICHWLDGSPLGIELAATWILDMGVAQIWRTLQESLDLLRTRMRDVPQRHRSLRTVLLHSWERLDMANQLLLKKLSVFHDGFSLDAAKVVCGGGQARLEQLADKSLLQLQTNGRFRLHEVVRQFSAEYLAQAPTLHETTQQQHATYYLSFLAQRELTLQGEHPQYPAAEIDEDLNNIRAGWQAVWQPAFVTVQQNQQVFPFKQAIAALSAYYQIRGLAREGKTVFGQMLTMLQARQPHNTPLLAQVWVEQARFMLRLAQSQQLVAQSQQHEIKGWLASTTQTSAAAAILTAEAHWRLGALAAAQEALSVARGVFDSAEFPQLEGAYQYNLGIIYKLLGKTTLAQTHLQKALAQWEQLNHARSRAAMLNALGDVAHKNKQPDLAYKLQTGALKIHQSITDIYGLSFDLNNLGILDVDKGDYANAKRHFKNALRLAKRTSNREQEGVIYHNLGWMSGLAKKHKEALVYLEQAYHIHQMTNDKRGQVFSLSSIAGNYEALGSLPQSAQYFEIALNLCNTLDYHPAHAYILDGLGRVGNMPIATVD